MAPALRTAAALLLALACAAPASALLTDAASGNDGRGDLGALDQLESLPPLRYANDDERGATTWRRELVGLVVAGREQPEGIEILRADGERIFLPLRALARVLGATVVDEPTGLRIDTPLGPARFDPGELRVEAGEAHVAMALASRRLALNARFDEAAYALVVDPAWPITATPGLAPDAPIRPDISAPGADLARLRGEVGVIHDDRGERYAGRLEAGGRLGPGTWQMRLQDPGFGPVRGYDYHWRVRHGDFAGQLGHQVLGLHPLLSSFDLTGVQGAWTNAPQRLYSPIDPDQLVADRPGAVRTLRGQGPPGGLAELVIEGRPVERMRIPLDGVFEFVSVPIPPGQVQIEVLLYDSALAGAPAARLDFSERASDRLLGAGEFVLHGGAGQDGNPLDDFRPDRGSAGFLRGRRAFGDRLTVQATLQRTGAGDQGLVGADALLGPVGVVSGAWARGEDGSAWLGSVEGGRGPVFWRGYALEQQAGFRALDTARLSERSAEVGWRRWPIWEVSMLARERRENGQPDVDFIKPAVRLRPLPNVFLQARPDFLGDYVYDAEWRPNRDLRLAGRSDSRAHEVSAERRFGSDWLLSAGSTEDRLLERRRDSVGLAWQAPDFGGWLIEGSVLHAQGDAGFLARVGRELTPGIQFRFEALRDPLYRDLAGQGGTTASLAVLFDLGRADGRFTRGGSVRADAGAIGGAIVATMADAGRLEGVIVRVDGQPRTRTDSAGRFHIAGLQPGVYRVELDEEGLPLELASRGDAYWAEVAAGAVTSVDFRIELRLGAAGRITIDGGALPAGARVEALAGDGRIAASALVDAYGWYRMDGLAPGAYSLRLVDAAGVQLARRDLVLTDQFVFGQDFTIAPVDPAPGTQP